MAMTSAQALAETVASINHSGYAYSSGNTLVEKEWNIIVENISKTEISLSPSRLFGDLFNASQPAVNFFNRAYPNANADDDLIRHYVMSIWLTQHLNSKAAWLVGLGKEIFDGIGLITTLKGEGFSVKDMGANFAGISGYTPEEAISKGLLSRSDNYDPTPQYNLSSCVALCAYLNPDYTESENDRIRAKSIFAVLSEGEPLSFYFNRGGGGGAVSYAIFGRTLDQSSQPNVFSAVWQSGDPQPDGISEWYTETDQFVTVTWPSTEIILDHKYTVRGGSHTFKLTGGSAQTLYPLVISYTSEKID